MPLNIAAYGQGSTMYPASNLEKNIEAIRKAGWTTIILGFLHVDDAGDVFFSESKILSCGCYVGDPKWPRRLGELFGEGSTLTHNLLAGIGGAKADDFKNIAGIYRSNRNSFDRTPLKENFRTLYKLFNSIDTIEMDVEEGNVDHEAFVAFCVMLHAIGFYITFCPYIDMQFWVESLVKIHAKHPAAVKWWDLQCYDGGAPNKPEEWAAAIKKALPNFDTTGFILASDWSRFWDDGRQTWRGDCPQAMYDKLVKLRGPSVGGAFVWNIGSILSYKQNQQTHPDRQPCGDVGMSDYVAAIAKAFG